MIINRPVGPHARKTGFRHYASLQRWVIHLQNLQPISEDEMIAVFLRTELASSRLTPTIRDVLARDRRDSWIISDPDLSNASDNAYRSSVLSSYRGFRRDRELFCGFPATVRWYRAVVTKETLARVRYINYDYWVDLSGGSRLPADAAARIRGGVEVFGVSNAGFWHLANVIAAGTTFPELIIVGAHEASPLILVEGHARLTAYYLRPENIPAKLQVIVGYAPNIAEWELY